MQAMDDIKEEKRLKIALLAEKTELFLATLEKLDDDDHEVYINGEAEALKNYCVVTKGNVKLKGADDEKQED
jgi:hypothetical protein